LQRIDSFLEEIWNVCHEFSYIGRAIALSGFGYDHDTAQEEGWSDAYKEMFGADGPRRGWIELDQRVKNDVPKLRQDLRAAFREILGASPPRGRGTS